MLISISNNYGGDVCQIEFREKNRDCFGIGVKIDGFIETNNFKLQHVNSTPVFVENFLKFKVPRNIIPTYKSKNFKVEYIVKCTMIFQNKKEKLEFPIIIHNNNLIDFNYESPLEIKLEYFPGDDFLMKREAVCKILLEKMSRDLTNNIENKGPGGLLVSGSTSFLSVPESCLESISSLDGVSKAKENPEFEQKMPDQYSSVLGADNKEDANGSLGLSKDFLKETQNKTEIAEDVIEKIIENESILQENINKESTDLEMVSKQDYTNDHTMCTNDHMMCTNDHTRCTIDHTMDKVKNILDEEKDKSSNQKIVAQSFTMNTDILNNGEITNEIRENLQQIISSTLESNKEFENCMQSAFKKIQDELVIPTFLEPNFLNLSNTKKKFLIVNENESIANVYFPEFVFNIGTINIEYIKDVKNTRIEIWREDKTEDTLVDAELVFSLIFDSEHCLEKNFEFEIKGFTLKTFIFETRFYTRIILDGYEANIPLTVVSKNANVIVTND